MTTIRKQKGLVVFLVVVSLFLFNIVVLAHPQVQNVILLIGDGMGIAQITAARIAMEDGAYSRLNLDTMPYTGFSINFSTDSVVTDSAAAATALATGFRTENKRIATLPDGTPVKSILLLAKEAGLSTGIVATVKVTDATPAAFVVNANSRSFEKDIAEAMIKTGVDVLMGGGSDLFGVNPFTREPRNRSLVNDARAAGYTYVHDWEGLMNLEITPDLKILGLFMGGDMSFELTRFHIEPSIEEMTGRALEVMSQNPQGFFLMVEGSRIDRAGHSNSPAEMIGDLLAFDRAVGIALAYAQEQPGTLVVVTADHETGGFGITSGSPSGDMVNYGWLSTGHTGTMVPIYAYGPGAERFTGTLQITDIPVRIAELMGIENFPQVIDSTF